MECRILTVCLLLAVQFTASHQAGQCRNVHARCHELADEQGKDVFCNRRWAKKKCKQLCGTCRPTDCDCNTTTTVQTSCSSAPHNCDDVQGPGPRPVVILSNDMEVMCDTVTDGGGWTVIQRRASADVDFYQDWALYKYGFGNKYGNHWLGLEKVHRLSFGRRYELRVDFTFDEVDYYALYGNFTLFGEPEKYRLYVSGFSGNAGDSLAGHSGRPFSTKDRDHDSFGTNSCARVYLGAWWYSRCHSCNLNGSWNNTAYGKGVTWDATTGQYQSATFTEMKIRPLDP